MIDGAEPRIRQNSATGMLYTNRVLTEDELNQLNRILFGDDSPQPGYPLGYRPEIEVPDWVNQEDR